MRRRDGSLHTEAHAIEQHRSLLRRTLLRGPAALADSLSIGLRALRVSLREAVGEAPGHTQMAVTVGLALVTVVAVFVAAPGVMVAGLLSAYVSTLITHLNWGTSYLVHDFYRRFITPDAPEKHYVRVGRICTALLYVFAGVLGLMLESAQGAFQVIISIGAGTGLLYLLRWFWWRINAWSEVAAMSSSFVVAVGFFVAARAGVGGPSHIALVTTVAVTTVVWVATAYLAPQTDRATLLSFYKLVRPAGPGWARRCSSTGSPRSPRTRG